MRHTDLGHNLDVINVYIQGHSHQLRARDPVAFGFPIQFLDQGLGHMDQDGPHRLRHKWVIPRKLLGNIYSSERSTGLRSLIAVTRQRVTLDPFCVWTGGGCPWICSTFCIRSLPHFGP